MKRALLSAFACTSRPAKDPGPAQKAGSAMDRGAERAQESTEKAGHKLSEKAEKASDKIKRKTSD